jgi:hypothetical protein
VTAHPDDLLRRADVVAWLRTRAVEVRGGLHGALLANERGLDADDIEAGAVAAAPPNRGPVLCRRPWYNAEAQEDQVCLRAAEHDGDCGPPLNLLDVLDLKITGGTDTILGVPVRTAPMPDGVVGMLAGARGQRVYIHTDGTTIEAPARCAAHGLVMCTALGCR